ncbi:hypothetical protein CTI12_AA623170 [Artemisia annua]|uniref:Uncharacterized protein n=1 Tax=Artemisia annua TaxID=35608 RepID=A0A2U1KB74_ARTAN|nr:hypothetical protein CTI12_AA623170 [Artemisia annua]
MEELGEWIPDFIDEKSTPDVSNTDGPERQPEKTPEEELEDLNGNMDDVSNMDDANERSNDNFNGNQPFPLNDTVANIDGRGENFVPAINFPFEQFLVDNNVSQTVVNKVSKRKKFKKGCGLERPSNAYSSSQESLKVVKRTKPSDPFGLNSLLGLNDDVVSDKGDEDAVLSAQEQQHFDLNCQTVSIDHTKPMNTEDARIVSPEVDY